MARKVDISEYRTFAQISDRLDSIVDAVRAKDISLERSLDLFDEAIALGSKAVDMVDTTNFTPEEEARLREKQQAEAAQGEQSQEAGEQGEAKGAQAEEAGEQPKEA